jgi:hypothetical protein
VFQSFVSINFNPPGRGRANSHHFEKIPTHFSRFYYNSSPQPQDKKSKRVRPQA